MKSILLILLALVVAQFSYAIDTDSVVVCKDRGSDGQLRTFLVDLGVSNFKKALLDGDAVYFDSNARGWSVFTGTTKLYVEKSNGVLHFAFTYTNLENGYNMTLGSGDLDIQFSADQNSVQDSEASCSIQKRNPNYLYSEIGLACAKNSVQTDWFIKAATLSRELIRSSTTVMPATDLISSGSQTQHQKSLTFAGSDGLSGYYNFMEAGAGNIHDMIEKHYMPYNAKVGAKANVLTSRIYPPKPADIESKRACVRKF